MDYLEDRAAEGPLGAGTKQGGSPKNVNVIPTARKGEVVAKLHA